MRGRWRRDDADRAAWLASPSRPRPRRPGREADGRSATASSTYGAGQYLVVSVDLPVTAHVIRAAPRAAVPRARPAPAAGRDRGAAAGARRPTAAQPTPPGIAVSDGHARAARPVVRLLRLLDRPDDLPVLGRADRAGDPLAADHRRAGRDWSARSGWPTAASRRSPARSGWIRSHYDDPFRVEELAPHRRDERLVVPPPFPRGHGDDADPVPEADPAAGGARPADRRAARRRRRRRSPSATRARRSSAASTAACSARRPAPTRPASRACRGSTRWESERAGAAPAR